MTAFLPLLSFGRDAELLKQMMTLSTWLRIELNQSISSSGCATTMQDFSRTSVLGDIRRALSLFVDSNHLIKIARVSILVLPAACKN